MEKPFKGFCPTLSKNKIIGVNYIDVSTTGEKLFVKERFSCEVANFGNCSIGGDCPIYKSALQQL